MREIKFRGKEINTGEWVYGFYMQGGWIDPNIGKETVRHIIHADFLHDVVPDTIGQFTGLCDKNGKYMNLKQKGRIHNNEYEIQH